LARPAEPRYDSIKDPLAIIELDTELRAIEALVDAHDEEGAAQALTQAHSRFGRRPDYRYVLCLFDATFGRRGDEELVRDVTQLAADQPDFLEAAALLAQLLARTGDRARAEVFGRVALNGESDAARLRAARALGVPYEPVPRTASVAGFAAVRAALPTSPSTMTMSVLPSSAPGAPTEVPVGGATLPARRISFADQAAYGAATFDAEPVNPRSLSARPPAPYSLHPEELPRPRPRLSSRPAESWFDRAKRELVHRRAPMHGVRVATSTVETLLDLARAVAEGRTPISSGPLPVDRTGLARVDVAIMQWRRSQRSTLGGRREFGETMAAAAFLMAAVMHELDGEAIDTAPEDGGCKVLVPPGVGIRPILVATAFARGQGASLVDTFDRLAAARSRTPATSPPVSLRRGSVQMTAIRANEELSPPLSVSVADAERSPLQVLETPVGRGPQPELDVAALLSSPTAFDIASLSAIVSLSPSPAGIEATEAYCEALVSRRVGARPGEEPALVAGVLLGEALIATFGGIWEADPAAPREALLFRVVCRERLYAWPILQAALRLRNGPVYDLVSYFGSASRLAQRIGHG
jgi:hypothetical protein